MCWHTRCLCLSHRVRSLWRCTRCFRVECKIATLTFFFRGFGRVFFARVTFGLGAQSHFWPLFLFPSKVSKSDSVRLIHFFIFDIFFEFLLIIFLIFFHFVDFLLSPRPTVCWVDNANFSRWFGGFGRGLEALGAFWSNLFWWFRPTPPAPCGGNAPTSTRMPRARPAPSLRRSAADLARDMRVEVWTWQG